jgi:spore maturation protein CgeB
MLTNWTEEQSEFFEDGKHCVFFHTREEMQEKATYYAARPDERMKIAAAGHAEARKHPYTVRAAQILKDCAA